MLTLTGFLNKYWQIITIAGLILYIVISGNSRDGVNDTNDRIDSILKVLTIPEKTGSFEQSVPQPIIIQMPQQGNPNTQMSDDLLEAFQELKDENEKTRLYAEAIARKVYNNKYSDSIVDITVDDIVEGGELVNQKVNWKVKPQEIKYHDKTYYLKPDLTVSAGLQFQTRIDSVGFSHEQIYPTIGIKGRNGWEFRGGINVLNTKEYMLGFSKDIFTKYNKPK